MVTTNLEDQTTETATTDHAEALTECPPGHFSSKSADKTSTKPKFAKIGKSARWKKEKEDAAMAENANLLM